MATIPGIEADTCPVCKSDRYLNPTMKLLVSPCFHKMCETCINRIFLQGPAPCPICRAILRKSNFVAQTFEDLYVEKEVQIRKKISRIYNKRQEDFKGNLKGFNDYLEQVEEILFNLINEVNVKETNEKIKEYEQENKDIISANLQKHLIEEKVAHMRLEREQKEKIIRKEAYEQAVVEEAKVKRQVRDEVIKRLEEDKFASADSIIADAAAKRQQVPDISKLLLERLMPADNDGQPEFLPDVDDTFEPMDTTYSDTPNIVVSDEYNDPWIQHMRLSEPKRADEARASGFSPVFTYERAIHSAFAGILVGAK
ncbi:CDK-activating kinase assembly factor MAT1-domain-containing protein [Phlyctochytrium arcticum]|nr:CDK-activating kinase assembly factor MAT1-domain-containing protein [Phlyctochytrium arcticum]